MLVCEGWHCCDFVCLWCRAAALGHFDVLQTLSAYGADFKARTSLALENAVHFALPTGNQNVIRFLGLRGIVHTNIFIHVYIHVHIYMYAHTHMCTCEIHSKL